MLEVKILKIISYDDPLSLLNICKKIEINLGRKKSKKNRDWNREKSRYIRKSS